MTTTKRPSTRQGKIANHRRPDVRASSKPRSMLVGVMVATTEPKLPTTVREFMELLRQLYDDVGPNGLLDLANRIDHDGRDPKLVKILRTIGSAAEVDWDVLRNEAQP